MVQIISLVYILQINLLYRVLLTCILVYVSFSAISAVIYLVRQWQWSRQFYCLYFIKRGLAMILNLHVKQAVFSQQSGWKVLCKVTLAFPLELSSVWYDYKIVHALIPCWINSFSVSWFISYFVILILKHQNVKRDRISEPKLVQKSAGI